MFNPGSDTIGQLPFSHPTQAPKPHFNPLLLYDEVTSRLEHGLPIFSEHFSVDKVKVSYLFVKALPRESKGIILHIIGKPAANRVNDFKPIVPSLFRRTVLILGLNFDSLLFKKSTPAGQDLLYFSYSL